MSNINLHNCDCMEFMKGVKDKAYDLAIVDVNYGLNIAAAGRIGNCNPFGGKKNFGSKNSRRVIIPSTDYGKKTWDKEPPKEEYWKELYRVSQNQIIWGANHIGNMKPSPGWIVWDKQNSGNYADCELAYTSYDVVTKIFQFRWNGMLQGDMANKEKRIHHTQKPVKLYKWVLNNYAKPGDRILDTHGGSMSIAIACYALGFDLDLCELDPDHFKAGQARLDAHIAKYAPASEIPVTKKGEIKLF